MAGAQAWKQWARAAATEGRRSLEFIGVPKILVGMSFQAAATWHPPSPPGGGGRGRGPLPQGAVTRSSLWSSEGDRASPFTFSAEV